MANNKEEIFSGPDNSPKGLQRVLARFRKSFTDLLPTSKSKELGGYFIFSEQEQSKTISVAPGETVNVSFNGSYGDFNFTLRFTNETTPISYNRHGMLEDGISLDVLLCQLMDPAGNVINEGAFPLEYYYGNTYLLVAGRDVPRIGTGIDYDGQNFDFKTKRPSELDRYSDYGFMGSFISVTKDREGRVVKFSIKLAPTMSARFKSELDVKRTPVV